MPASAQATPACRSGAWSTPVALFEDSTWLADPALAFRDGRTLVVGTSRGTRDRDVPWDGRYLRGVEVGGGPLLLPEAGRHPSGPVAAVGRTGDLHLFWAEPAEHTVVSDTAARPPPLGRIRHSVHSPSRLLVVDGREVTWSPPEVVYAAETVEWEGGGGSPVLVGPDGTVHLAFSVDGLRWGTVHVRLGPQAQRTTEFLGEPEGSPALASGPGGRLLTAYVGTAPGTPIGVLFRASADRGASWPDSATVAAARGVDVRDVRLAVAADGRIHALWLERPEWEGPGGVVRHARSDDRGRTWSEPGGVPGLPDGATAREIEATVDGAGTLHLLVAGSGALHHARLDAGGWSAPCRPDPGFAAHDVGVATDERGRVHLVWNRVTGTSPARSAALHSTLDPSADAGGG